MLRNIAEYYFREGNFRRSDQEADRRANEVAVTLPDDKRAPVQTDLAETYAINHQLDLAQEAILKARSVAKFNNRIASHDEAHIVFVESMIADQRGDPKADAGYRRGSKLVRSPGVRCVSKRRSDAPIG